ncbi:LCP family protein [Massilimicrobiota sp. An105]|uniref:LCP family protein n=1 Tax=Massilimicrobiota sp. An105 TaxID=1965540 RepID=UPI001F15535B|nr:LCP family protein [Massilimicrobiota sp. An105]
MLKKIIKNFVQWKVMLIIQIIISVIFTIFLIQLNVLPLLYNVLIIIAEMLCALGVCFLIKNAQKIRLIIGHVLSILIIIVLIMGCFVVNKGQSTLKNVTSDNVQTNRISLYVLDESSYKELSDLKNQNIEANVNDEHMAEAIDALNKEVKLSIQGQEDYVQMSNDLYDQKTVGIYMNEAQSALFDEIHEDFHEKTRVLYTYEIEEKVEDFSKDVSVTQNTFNVFISGIDTTGPVSTVSRSDVNMIVTVDPTNKKILMTSIPRDYYVTLANMSKKDKLTHAGLAGVENSVKTLENFLDIDINYYARVNFTSLIQMVDALGGIEVYSDQDIPKLGIHEGVNQMDGKKALSFSRERYSYKSGDNHRVQNQQKVLEAMLNKMMSPAIITNYSSILENINGSFETNMTSQEITSLLKMQLSDMAKWDIQQIQLEGHGAMMTGGAYMPNHKLYYMIPDQSSVDKCVSIIKDMED